MSVDKMPAEAGEVIKASAETPAAPPGTTASVLKLDREQLDAVLRFRPDSGSRLRQVERIAMILNFTVLIVGGGLALWKYFSYERSIIQAEASPHLRPDFDLKMAVVKKPEGRKPGEYNVVYELKLNNNGKSMATIKSCELTPWIGKPKNVTLERVGVKHVNLPPNKDEANEHIKWDPYGPIPIEQGIGQKRPVAPNEFKSIKQGFRVAAEEGDYLAIQCVVKVDGEKDAREFLQWRRLDEAGPKLEGEIKLP